MQIKHINLLVNALNLASKRGTTVSQHVRAVTHNLLFDEIVATACGGLGYYLAVYFFDYLFFFVPWVRHAPSQEKGCGGMARPRAQGHSCFAT